MRVLSHLICLFDPFILSVVCYSKIKPIKSMFFNIPLHILSINNFVTWIIRFHADIATLHGLRWRVNGHMTCEITLLNYPWNTARSQQALWIMCTGQQKLFQIINDQSIKENLSRSVVTHVSASGLVSFGARIFYRHGDDEGPLLLTWVYLNPSLNK